MKNTYVARGIFLLQFFFSINCSLTTLAAMGGGFQAPFDFDKFLSELEGALAEIEKEEQTKSPSSSLPTGGKGSVTSAREEKVVISKPDGAEQKKDPESLFKDPILQKISQKGSKQERTEPTQESLAAYTSIMAGLVKNLSAIEKILNGTKTLSPEFKEEALSFTPIMNAITIAHEQLESKKAYKQLFLAPPESNKVLAVDLKQLRGMIVTASHKIETAYSQLVTKTTQHKKDKKKKPSKSDTEEAQATDPSSEGSEEEEFEEDVEKLLKSLAKPKKEKSPKKSSQQASMRDKKNDNQQDVTILETFESLIPIAQGLAKFTGSKETEEVVKRKKQQYEQREKEAEARRKQSSASGSRRSSSGGGGGGYYPRSSSSSGYADGGYRGGSGYGGGSYYSPSGSSSSPWGANRSSTPWATTPSGSYPGSTRSYDDDYDDDDYSSASNGSSNTKTKQQKDHGPAFIPEANKEAESNYTKAFNYTKEAADNLKTALDTAKQTAITSGKKDDAAKSLLSVDAFGKLKTALEDIDKAKKELNATDISAFEKKKDIKLSKEEKRLTELYKTLFPYALTAATFGSDDLPYDTTYQSSAIALFKDSKMQAYIDQQAVNDRAQKLLDKWEKKEKASHKMNHDAFKVHQSAKATGTAVPAGTTPKANVKTYFENTLSDLSKILNNFPIPPNVLTKKIESIKQIINDDALNP